MQSEKVWTAALAVIGDEILSGRTQDKNVAQVASWPTFLSWVRPDRISSPITTKAAVQILLASPTHPPVTSTIRMLI